MLAVTFRRQVAAYLTCLEEHFIDRMSLSSVLHRIAVSSPDCACTLLSTPQNCSRSARCRSTRVRLFRRSLTSELLPFHFAVGFSQAKPQTITGLNLQNVGIGSLHQYTRPALPRAFFVSSRLLIQLRAIGSVVVSRLGHFARQTIQEHTFATLTLS